MRHLTGCLLLALLYSVNSHAVSPIRVFLQCANGIHATMKDGMLSAEGIFNLPFESSENENDDQTILVFADTHVEAKILIRYADASFFLQNTDGSWIPCKANRINTRN